MSEVRIRWSQRAAGRNVGDVETLELTPWIEAILAAGRAVVLSPDDAPIELAEEVVEEAPKPRRPRPAAPIVGVFEGEVGDGDAEAE